jgi:hypothetical protein
MSISFQCACGKQYFVGEQHAGKSTSCQACGATIVVPAQSANTSAPIVAPAPLRPAPRPANDAPQAAVQVAARSVDEPVKAVVVEPSATPPKSQGLALPSALLGLSSFFMICFTGIPAIVLGILSLKKIGDSRGRLGGKGYAITGSASGTIGILLTFVFVPLIFSINQKATSLVSAHNMRTLTVGVLDYGEKNQRWPDSIDDLAPHGEGKGGLRRLMMNPVTGDDPGYEYVKPVSKYGEGKHSDRVVFYQLRDGKRDLSLKVGYLDARVANYEKQREGSGPQSVNPKKIAGTGPVAVVPVAKKPDEAERTAADREQQQRADREQKAQERKDRDRKERERRERERQERERQKRLAKPDPIELALQGMSDLDNEWAPYHAAGNLMKIPPGDISPEQMKQARELLVGMAESSSNHHRQRGTRVFSHFAGPEQVSLLEKFADAPDKENKAWGPPLAALIRLAPERGRAILRKRFGGFNYRGAVTQSLCELPSEYEVEFWPLLTDADKALKTGTIGILERMGTSDSIPELQKLMQNVSAKERSHYKRRIEGAIRGIERRTSKNDT